MMTFMQVFLSETRYAHPFLFAVSGEEVAIEVAMKQVVEVVK